MQLKQIDQNVCALAGPFGNCSPANFGNNSTSGFVVTADGVMLVDPGGCYKGAIQDQCARV